MDITRKFNALIKYHLHIPFPEKLSDEDWAENYRQVLWVLDFESRRFNLKEGEQLKI